MITVGARPIADSIGRLLTELDYFDRDPSAGFEIEVVVAELNAELLADAADGLEGWRAGVAQLSVPGLK